MNKNIRLAAYAIAIVAVAAFAVFQLPQLLDSRSMTAAKHSKACDDAISSGVCEHGKKCTVTVTVSACGAGVKPDVQPETLAICEKTARITWRLVGLGTLSGVKFAGNGVAFKAADGGTSEFEDFKVKEKTYEWSDKHSKRDADPPVAYGYGLHVLQKDASPCIDFDPRVSNE